VDARRFDLLQRSDENLLEFIAMLPDPPRPEAGVVRWSEWRKQDFKF